MDIKTLPLFLILLAAFGSAVWNIHVKKSNNSLVFVTLMVIPQFLMALPLIFWLPLPLSESWLYILASGLVQTGYIVFLSYAYQHGLLSRIYPLAIGTAPLLSLLYWRIFFGKALSTHHYYGVLLLSFGIISFAFVDNKKKAVLTLRGISYALATSLFIFLYSLIDTFGIRTGSDVFSYISWLFVIKALMLFIPMLFLHKIHMQTMARQSTNYIIAGLLAGFGYAVAIFAFTQSATSVVLALRSTSILFVFLLSTIFLKEKASFKIFVLTCATTLGTFLIFID